MKFTDMKVQSLGAFFDKIRKNLSSHFKIMGTFCKHKVFNKSWFLKNLNYHDKINKIFLKFKLFSNRNRSNLSCQCMKMLRTNALINIWERATIINYASLGFCLRKTAWCKCVNEKFRSKTNSTMFSQSFQENFYKKSPLLIFGTVWFLCGRKKKL